MRKIRDAYREGVKGIEGSEREGRIARTARRAGKRTLESIHKEHEALERAHSERLQSAIDTAKGSNKTALEIVQAAEQIPDPDGRVKLSTAEMIDERGNITVQHNVSLVRGVNRDPSRLNKTPVVQGLGTLKIDSTDWSHNGLNVPVDNISIKVTSPKNESGEMQPSETTVWVNTREYDPEKEETYKREFGEQVRIDVDTAGHVSAIGVSEPGWSGYRALDVDTTYVEIDGLLSSVLASVQQTTAAYAEIHDSINGI